MADRRAGRVLVGDDEQDTCRNLSDIITDLGCRFDWACDGEAALELVRDDPYDVARLDLKMPGMDGLTVTREIEKVRPEVVALLGTACVSGAMTGAALGTGACGVVPKTVDLAGLLGLVERAMGQPPLLVVDDVHERCENLRQILRDRGHRVGLAHDGIGAGEQPGGTSYRVALIDMELPGGDVSGVFRMVRRADPTSRTVLITGSRPETDRLIGLEFAEGADGVCYKPFDVPKLLEQVGRPAHEGLRDDETSTGLGPMSDDLPGDLLVIEDDPDARANLRDILELDGYRVEEAGTAAEALRREDWPRFAAIILDRQLPDASAEELLPRLAALAPDAAVIIVTGYSDLHGPIAALRQGAADYIVKPLNPDLLRATLGRVAERRRLSRAKERSEAAFRHLVEAAEAMIVILRPDRRIAYLSPYAERLTGYAAADAIGRDFFPLFIPGSDRAVVAEEFDRVLAGHHTPGYHNPIVCRDGTRRWMVWNSRTLDDYEGAQAVLAVGQDITALKLAQERALQAERLAAIGQMVAGLAHESRNALQRSQACLEMLALKVADRHEALDLIARIQKAQNDLHHLYQDVRDYAAPILLDRRPCDLGGIWREAWDHLQRSRRGGEAGLVEEVARGVDLCCDVDPFRMEQVFRNVLENALSAGQAPVRITILAEDAEIDGRPALRVLVQDDGPGLDPEQRQKAFDAFFTTKAKGTGLGLAIVRRIVEAHGGRVATGDSGPPGAEFVITLPRNHR